MRFKVSKLALSAGAGIICLISAFLLLHAIQDSYGPDGSAHYSRDVNLNYGVAHENSARASLIHLSKAATQLSTELTSTHFLKARELHSFHRRDALRCDDGPCVDGSCCGKNNTCGFGPEFCGDGCHSQCDATAMCGEFSDGDMSCGMKLCCSAMGWCGTTDTYCHYGDMVHKTLPCQAGYGSCAITGPHSCPEGGGSTNGRKIGYYQSWNMRNRKCNRVSPKQLDTTGYTHIFYSFASIDPNLFTIQAAHPDDEAMMKEFTGLKSSTLKTWIAVGGFDMSDPEKPTHTTWSDMCLTQANRAVFISSIKAYMVKYGFQGVDIDWEYPGATERGGRKMQDVSNLVALIREMRAAFGTSFGISVTLAPDYWYLRWFDAKGMEPYVDFFGFMAYDLHGSWDKDVHALGKIVRGQADIREISNNSVPLWFDGLDPAKINFGLAMYGRGYTLAESHCNDLGCKFAGPSLRAPCTYQEGVMSLLEIQQLIKRRGLTPKYLRDSMMKQITWDDQWIGYDDEETFAAKNRWADGRCFGGTMVWSIDFEVAGSGDSDEERYGSVIYVGTEAYQKPTAQCSPPCIMVFPPSTLSQPTVITLPAYTATLEVGNTKTTVVAKPSPTTSTVTVIEFFNYYVTTSQKPGAPLTLRPSFTVPPVTVVVTGQDKKTTSRVIHPPPLGVPTAPGQSSGNPGDPDQPSTVIPGGIDTTGLFWFPPTSTPDPEIDPDLEEGPVLFPDPEEDGDDDDNNPGPIPWPSGTILPVLDINLPKPEGTSRSSCKLWFFSICISWPEININVNFWDFTFPPGVIGPGPPPISFLKLPPGWSFGKITPTLPPWPRMTVGSDGALPPEPPKPEECEPTTAKLTIESTSYGTTTTRGTVSTTTTKTFSREFPLVGCSVKDSATASTTTGCAAPTKRALPPSEARNTDAVQALGIEAETAEYSTLQARAGACNGPRGDYLIMPSNHNTLLLSLRAKLTADSGTDLDSFTEVSAPAASFTGFFYLTNAKADYVQLLKDNRALYGMQGGTRIPNPPLEPAGAKKRSDSIEKRDSTWIGEWAPSQICAAPGQPWDTPNGPYRQGETFKYSRHNSECNGQYIYVIEEAYAASSPMFARQNIQPLETADYGNWRDVTVALPKHGTGVLSMVAQICPKGRAILIPFVMGSGSTLKWHASLPADANRQHPYAYPLKRLEALVMVLEEIVKTKTGPMAVVNMSWGIRLKPDLTFTAALRAVLKALEARKVVLVASSGNIMTQDDINVELPLSTYPQLFATDGSLPNLVLAGATDRFGRRTLFSQGTDDQVVYAPGRQVQVAAPGGNTISAQGTSHSSPMLAGLVAYFRALPGPLATQLREPATMKTLLRKMQREVRGAADRNRGPEAFQTPGTENKYGRRVKFIWNGQHPDEDVSCLVDMKHKGCYKIDLSDPTPIDTCTVYKRHVNGSTILARQDDGTSCGLDPNEPDDPSNPGDGGGQGPGDGQGPTKTITYSSGTPSPTCVKGCGKLCTDFWCRPDPTDTQPPFFTDPSRLTTSVTKFTPTNAPILTFETDPPIPTNCASTTTWTSCNVGGGGGHEPACVTHSSCASTSAKLTPTVVPTSILLSGFPTPTRRPEWDAICGCPKDSPHGAVEACAGLAREFVNNPDRTFLPTTDRPIYACTNAGRFNGKDYVCKINFEILVQNPKRECRWTGREAANDYAYLWDACSGCGWVEDRTFSCALEAFVAEGPCSSIGDPVNEKVRF